MWSVGLAILGAASAAQTAPVQPPPARMAVTPAAMQLLERDWVLMNWALKYFDANHDIMLQPNEAQAAADTFRRIADTNHDGRVTQEEYRAARTLILFHY